MKSRKSILLLRWPMVLLAIAMIFSCSKEENSGEISIDIVVPDELNFGFFQSTQPLEIYNRGAKSVEWDLYCSEEMFTFSQSAGELKAGDSFTLVVGIDREDLLSQTYHAVIHFKANGEEQASIPVKVDHYNNPVLLDKGALVDAVYDRVHDRIVMVFENPHELRRFDPVSGLMEVTQLVLPPNALSVGMDGNYAAVAHDGRFSYVNLINMETEQVFQASTDVGSLVLAPNNWVYLTSKDKHIMRCVSLETGQETHATGVGHSSSPDKKIRLHPSGEYLYWATTNNPSSLEKLSIAEGTAEFLYRYPYHGIYEPGKNLWLSDDGKKIFTQRFNYVFNTSENREEDMIYAGQLEANKRLFTIDHNSQSGRVYAIHEGFDLWSNQPDSVIWKYEDNYMGLLGKSSVPKFLTPNETGDPLFIDALGYFIFFNSDGSRYYVLQKPVQNSWIEEKWYVSSGDVE